MKYKYVGHRKINIHGKTLWHGDIVELDERDDRVEWEYFRPVKEEKPKKSKNKKEVDDYGENLESKGV